MIDNEPKPIIVLPLGAYEQHGPHLPPETDAIIAKELAGRLKAAVSKIEIEVLPTEEIGYSIEHLDFGNTKSLEYNEAITRWLGIIKSQYDSGHNKILLLNAHGGNSPLLTIVATEARIRWNMLVVVTHWTRFGLPDKLSVEIDKSIDIHAGDIETSIMLAIAPEKVGQEKTQAFQSRQKEYAEKFKHLRAYGPHAFGWKMSDLNAQGATGRADLATAEKGKHILDHAIKGLTELINDIDQFDISELK